MVVAVRENHGRVVFVQLQAPTSVLMSWVGNASRAQLQKMTSSDRLRNLLADRDLTASVAYPEQTLHLDTSIYDPAAAAHRIAARFGLVGSAVPAAVHTGEHD